MKVRSLALFVMLSLLFLEKFTDSDELILPGMMTVNA